MINLTDLEYKIPVVIGSSYVMKRPKDKMTKKHRDGNMLPDYELITTIEKTRDIRKGIDKYYISNLYSHLKSNGKLDNEQEILDILKSVLYCLRADGRLYSKEFMIKEIEHFFEIYSEDSTPLDSNYINKTIAPNVIKYGVVNESIGRSYIQIIDNKIVD